MSTDLLQ